jgi:hypothetical protein
LGGDGPLIDDLRLEIGTVAGRHFFRANLQKKRIGRAV